MSVSPHSDQATSTSACRSSLLRRSLYAVLGVAALMVFLTLIGMATSALGVAILAFGL